jgi:PAS domain S-box-containing protein
MPEVAEIPSQARRLGIPVPEPDCLERGAPRQSSRIDNKSADRTGADATRRILVVDDDSDVADSLSDLLRLNGYAVESANSGEEALDIQDRFDPAIAIVDVRLGGTSGIELIAELKRRQASLVCITATAYADIETAINAVRAGIDDFLLKPLNDEELVAVLERCFDKARLARERQSRAAASWRSEPRLKQLAAHLPGLIYQIVQRHDGTLETIYVGGAIQDLYEHYAEGRLSKEDLVIQVIHPDDWDQYYGALVGGEKELQPYSVEFRVITKSGDLKWIHAVSRPRLLGKGDILWNGIAIDFTARKLAEEELRAAKESAERANPPAWRIGQRAGDRPKNSEWNHLVPQDCLQSAKRSSLPCTDQSARLVNSDHRIREVRSPRIW